MTPSTAVAYAGPSATADVASRGGLRLSADEQVGPLVARGHGVRDRVVRRSLAAADLSAVAIAMVVGAILAPDRIALTTLLVGAAVLMPLWLGLFKAYGLYDRDVGRINVRSLDDGPAMFHAVLLGTLLTWLLLKVASVGVGTWEMAAFGLAVVSLALPLRGVARRLVLRELGPERLLIVGDPRNTNLRSKLGAHPEYGVASVRELDDLPESVRQAVLSLDSLQGHDCESIMAVARDARAERLIISDAELDQDDLAELLRACKRAGLKASLLPHVFDVLGPSVCVDDVEGVTLIGIRPPVLPRSSRFLKRGLDICGATVVLLVTAPLLAVIALLVKLDSRGPVVFRQERIGREGRRFRVAKFRTMSVDAENHLEELRSQSSSAQWLKVEHDPRITRIGRILRLTSLDELPQFWNVLRGDMSIVGPRPLSVTDNANVAGWARNRVDLAPGITGLWQVLGRTDIPFDEMVRLDFLYVTNWSLWADIRIILDTVPAMITGHGAN